jgi:DNA-binding XRE family transcriptional regulator
MNALDRYLEGHDIKNAVFAATVGASEATISRLRNNKQTPSFALARRIRTATEGAVTFEDFLPASEVAA